MFSGLPNMREKSAHCTEDEAGNRGRIASCVRAGAGGALHSKTNLELSKSWFLNGVSEKAPFRIRVLCLSALCSNT